MGFENTDGCVAGDAAMCPSWEALGKLVQAATLEAVSQHFFQLGLAELCMKAMDAGKGKVSIGTIDATANPSLLRARPKPGRSAIRHQDMEVHDE